MCHTDDYHRLLDNRWRNGFCVPRLADAVRVSLFLLFAITAFGQTPLLPPIINGIVPIYGTANIIQPGSWFSIYGIGLTCGVYEWNGDFPTRLGVPQLSGTVTVSVNGSSAYIWYASPTQINAQAPDDTTTGRVDVHVDFSCGNPGVSGGADATVTLAPVSPCFILIDATHPVAEIATPNGSGAYGNGAYDLLGPPGFLTTPTRRVRPGETLVLYGVGFGPTTPMVLAGRPFVGAAPTIYPVTATIGGKSAPVAFSGTVEAGLYQINVTVPDLPAGDLPLEASVDGVGTQAGIVVAVE
jgi:uncharacterized protein (TIGR03437 family)